VTEQENILRGIGFIGAGNMGSALVRGLVGSGKTSGITVTVFDVDRAKVSSLEKELGIRGVQRIQDVVSPETDVLVLAVKPQIMGTVIDSIKDEIRDDLVVLSIAAGISTSFILSHLKGPARVIRAMPNAAAMVGTSATALCKAGTADDADMAKAVEIFASVGTAVAVDEKLINPVTALASSGLAYIFVIMEALTDAGVRMGMDRPTARDLTVQTLLGAATMAAAGNPPFSELKDRITSPGGTTIVGLQVMERAGLRGVLMDVVEAATRRADELVPSK
jgi:pyrroline-5-carboxylate reductase